MSPDNYDEIVQAEIPDSAVNPKTYVTVIANMVHGPCGHLNPNAPCMTESKNGRKQCKKGYPKQFQEETIHGNDSYPIYRRRNDGRYFELKVKNRIIKLDNRWIVPYNNFNTTVI